MKTVARYLLIYLAIALVVTWSASISPFSPIRPNMVGFIGVYAVLRTRGWETLFWLLSLLSLIGFSPTHPHAEWGPLLSTIFVTYGFRALSKQLYVESYLIEAFHVTLLLLLSTLLSHLYLAVMIWEGGMQLSLLRSELLHTATTGIPAFFLLIVFDNQLQMRPS